MTTGKKTYWFRRPKDFSDDILELFLFYPTWPIGWFWMGVFFLLAVGGAILANIGAFRFAAALISVAIILGWFGIITKTDFRHPSQWNDD